MILDSLKTPFRWYTSLQDTLMMRADCPKYRYKLITPKDRLLPFMFRFPTPDNPSLPAHLKIYNSDTGALSLAVNDNFTINEIDYYRYDGWDYLIYKGDSFHEWDNSQNIPEGFHYAELEMMDGTKFYSEEFWIDCDVDGNTISGDFSDDFNDDFSNTFTQQGILLGMKKYTKLTWFHNCDIGNLLYQSGYANMLYIDSDIIKEAPEILEEGKEDGNKDFVATFVKLTDNILLVDYMPEHVVTALTAVGIHRYVYVTTKMDGYIGKAKRFQVAHEYQNSCYARVEIRFQLETTLLRSQCCVNTAADNIYMCPSRISSLIEEIVDNGNGTKNVVVSWQVDLGAGPYQVVSAAVSGGVPQETLATSFNLGNHAPGTIIPVEVKPKCQAANGRVMYGNRLFMVIAVP